MSTQPISDPIIALATARKAARVIRATHDAAVRDRAVELMIQAVDALDNAGIFAKLDEETEYASATEVLEEVTLAGISEGHNAAEWGDYDTHVAARRVRLMQPVTALPEDRMNDVVVALRAR